MGFLDKFKGTGSPRLAVAVEPATALPGDHVRVRVNVTGAIDDKVDGALAGIRCVNDYLTKEYDRQEHEWDEVWRSLTLHEDQGVLPLELGEHELTFTIPDGLPPE